MPLETDQNRHSETYGEKVTIRESTYQEYNFADYSRMIWVHRWKIFINISVVTMIAIGLSLMVPKTYRAYSVLMPPVQSQSSGIMSTLSNLPLGGLLPQSTDETMSFLAILKSRTLMESVINKFDLINKYEAKNMEEAIRILSGNIASAVEEEGTITISASVETDWFHPDDQEASARELSANMVNFIVEQLDYINKKLQTQQASFQRVFIEGRYEKNVEELREAEERLKEFQQDENMIVLSDQTSAAISIAATIKGEILANEVKIGVMKSTLNPGHPELARLKKENKELEKQLQEMDSRKSEVPTREDKLFPAFSDVPELGVKLMRLKREVEIKNALFTFLTQQYEEAKIQEAKDTPTVQVLDRAAYPIKKYRPRRALMVISTFLIASLINVMFVIARTNNRKLD